MVARLQVAHLAVLSVAVLTNVGVIYWVRRRADGRAADLFVVNLAFATMYAAGGIVQTLVPGYGPKVVVAAVRYVPLWGSIVVWVGFAFHYAGRERYMTRRVWAGLFGLAAVCAGLEVTNPLHGLVFENVVLDPEPFPHLVADRTMVFWAVATPAYLLLLLSVAVLGLALLNSRRVSRRQPLLMGAGVVPAVLVSVAQSAGYLPSEGFEYLSVTGAGFSLMLAYALFGEDLFAVDPVSRAAVIESVTDAIVVLDGRHRLVDFNDAATALGVDEGDIGEDVGAVLPGVVAGDATTDGGTRSATATLSESLGDVGADTTSPGVEDEHGQDHAHDAERFADRLVAPVRAERREFVVEPSVVGNRDRPEGYVVVLRDVTEVEAYAARLQRQTDQLDRFASTVSHDLRNPMSVARGYVETAVESGDDGLLEEAVAALDRADEIIEQSLALAREGQAIQDRRQVDLAAVAREAWATADTGDATLDVETTATVSGDRERLLSLLENLFRNAVSHGGATTVTVRGTESGFAVADDGSGIDPDVRDSVFDRGYTTSQDGTGLGLAIVESIADAHGWTASVGESESGGARFDFGGVNDVASASAGSGTAEAPFDPAALDGDGATASGRDGGTRNG